MKRAFVASKLLSIGVSAALLVSGEAIAQTSKAQADPQRSTIVFVCEHGSAKSVVAAAHFNRLAAEKGLPYRALARGTAPDEAVAMPVRNGLASEGLDVSGWKPAAISDQEIRRATHVVSIATDLPATRSLAKGMLIEWNDIPSISQDYDAARKAIVARVESLIQTLSASQKK
jgi:protein-tyrosine-phosphatase